MENVINFLEKYWGVSIAGGLTFGTLTTFIVVQIKTIFRDKAKTNNLNTAMNKVDSLCNELNVREEQHKKEREELEQTIAKQQADAKYFNEVQAATFQAISYLVVASKLPTEDKIALQEKFTSLITNKASEYKEILKDEVIALNNEVTEKIIPDATQTVAQIVEDTQSLLDKYMKEG